MVEQGDRLKRREAMLVAGQSVRIRPIRMWVGDELRMIEMSVRKSRAAYVVAHEEGYQQQLQPFYASQNAHFSINNGANVQKIVIPYLITSFLWRNYSIQYWIVMIS